MARAQLRVGASGGDSAAAVAVHAVPVPVVHDPLGDVPFPQGDIVGAGFGQDANGFVFSMDLFVPTNPATDPNWLDGLALAGWLMDVDADGNPDYLVLVSDDPLGHVTADLLSASSPDVQCSGHVSFVAAKGLRAAFGSTCTLPITRFRMQAAITYTDDPNASQPPTDFAPDQGWSHTIKFSGGAPARGYWMLDRDGRAFAFGAAPHYPGAVGDGTAIASKPGSVGYWIVGHDGSVHAFGTALSAGGKPSLWRGEVIVAVAASPGAGYWLFSNRGRVFPEGGAHCFGDLSDTRLHAPVVAGASSLSGLGYTLFASDGGVFAFGDAKFRGSLAGHHLNGRIVGAAESADGDGYSLVGSDGGVFAFGDAPFRGSLAGHRLNKPAVGIIAFGDGYLVVAADGGAFDFSSRRFLGGLGGRALAAPITGVAALTT